MGGSINADGWLGELEGIARQSPFLLIVVGDT